MPRKITVVDEQSLGKRELSLSNPEDFTAHTGSFAWRDGAGEEIRDSSLAIIILSE